MNRGEERKKKKYKSYKKGGHNRTYKNKKEDVKHNDKK